MNRFRESLANCCLSHNQSTVAFKNPQNIHKKTWIYQINQQLHDFICDEILGVIQKNVSILSFQYEAVQIQKEEDCIGIP